MSVVLRAARSTDAGKTGAILDAFCSQTRWMPKLHSGAEAIAFCGKMIDQAWVTVAQERGDVVGFLARDDTEIVALYVRDRARGQGIGTRLLQGAQSGTDHLQLWTFQANTGAQRFYERHGFGETARSDGASNDENLPDIHYVWTKGAQNT